MKISYFNYIADVEGHGIGAINKSESFVNGLTKLGHTVHTNWLERDTQPSLSGILKDDARLWVKERLRKYAYEPKMILKNLPLYYRERNILDAQKPDAILDRLNPFYFTGAALARARRLPLVVECDGPSLFEYLNFMGKENLNLTPILKRIQSYILGSADACLLISDELKTFFKTLGIDEEKLHVIPNGADPERFYPMPRHAEIASKYNLSGQTVVGWAGSLYGWSGIEKLVAMVKEVVANREDVSFLFLCGGENKRFFLQHFPQEEYGRRVILPGMIPYGQVNDYFSCMDIMLAPYPYQALWYASSMKIFEYMAAGKAVISSSIGQVNEIIDDGVNGFLVDPREPDELIEKVKFLIDEPALQKQAGQNARETILKQYTWDIQSQKMADVFELVRKKYRGAV